MSVLSPPTKSPWTEVVRPASARRETIAVALSCVVVTLLAGIIIGLRGRVEATQELAEYQVSAYDGLNPTEQGIYNDMLAASLDIDLYHSDTLRWPSVLQLQGQYIAPFVRDLSWQQRGGLEWQMDVPDMEQQHTVAYYALSPKPEVTGSFLLWMTHKHNMMGPAGDAFLTQRGKKAPGGPGPGNMSGRGDPLAQGNLQTDLSFPGLPAPSPTLTTPGGAVTSPPAGGAAAVAFKPQVRVWYHPGAVAEAPGVYLDEQLIKTGWREVIARTGTDETKRLRGTPGQ
jgi:hypothetical protein